MIIFCTIILVCTLFLVYFTKKSPTIDRGIDQAILITGCDSGIGLELAKYFHNSFRFKIVCGFLNSKNSNGYTELSKLAEDDPKNRLILRQLDLTSEEDVNGIVDLLAAGRRDGLFNDLFALINNAGVLTYGEFDWQTWDQVQVQIDVNLIGTLRLTRALAPFIIESKGRIINVSSVNDSIVFPGLSVYSATKGALSSFSKGLGFEMRKFGAHVVTIRLGDFARLTNIMTGHAAQRDSMWSGMNPSKQNMYHDYFHEFNRHLMKNYGMTSPKDFYASSLFHDFTRAVMMKNPPATITCAPIGFRIFYSVMNMIPVELQYPILDLLIRTGFRWKPPLVMSNNSRNLDTNTQ